MPIQRKKDPDLFELLKSQNKEEKPDATEISWRKDSIIVTEFEDGNEQITHYDEFDNCMECNKMRLCSSETGGYCPICNKTISLKDYLEHFPEKQTTESLFEADDKTPNEVKTIEYTDKPDAPKKVIDITPESDKHYDLQKVEHKHELMVPMKTLATKQEVDAFLDMYNYVKSKIVDRSDFQTYQGTPRMKKSGWRKFIKPFNLSIEVPPLIVIGNIQISNPKIYEAGVCEDGTPNIHAEVRATVFVTGIQCPSCGMDIKGQSIMTIGTKSKSEYWSDRYKNFGSYNQHNLISTARTRAINIGISDLVGFGEVSFEEVVSSGDNEVSKEDSKKKSKKNQESMFED